MDATEKAPRIRVLIVDDHAMLREGVAASVASQPDMEVVGQAASAEEALEQYAQIRPDVTLMDLRLPNLSGVTAIERIHAGDPKARVIALTTYQGEVLAVRAFRAGAMGYLLKSSLRRALFTTIRAVHAGQTVIPPDIATAIALHVAEDQLSNLELDILKLVAGGLPDRLIASRLSLNPDEIKSRIAIIVAKLGGNDRPHAVAIAVKRGYFDLET